LKVSAAGMPNSAAFAGESVSLVSETDSVPPAANAKRAFRNNVGAQSTTAFHPTGSNKDERASHAYFGRCRQTRFPLIELFLDQSGQIHLLGLKVALRSGDNQNVFDRIFRIPG